MAAAAQAQYYNLYRGSSVGEALIDAIDELINQSRIEPQLAMKILDNFDRAMYENLSANVKTRVTFKGHLETYRFCDDVWTFLVKDVKFKSEGMTEFTGDKVKIISCNAKKPGEQ
ncbi:Transcription initiation factor IIA subunit 2 [Cyphellophora attinorum]|uniref:Transcription initiation factor IIA subunit 2 n=1 Tax=Cyphellophora attinorum TaxID=1664694 RepID=A0A0N1NY17_9EURO|nr:Transcription initiation factor IIA subunit 2 [Phialophora attinorum]KPI38212.1 Transcription initiation factor IIA subunit 2 [Phialophora attinorum]